MMRCKTVWNNSCAWIGYTETAQRRLVSSMKAGRRIEPKSANRTTKNAHQKASSSKKQNFKKGAVQFKKQLVVVPPTYLSPTASTHVYAAKCALDEAEIDPLSLFDDADVIPESFRKASFEYISPKLFGQVLPQFRIPEVAFVGRSNVGKSSLVNALMRQDLARSSKRPGRTQQVNYFGLLPTAKGSNRKPVTALGFVIDLPGYGFAKAPNEAVAKWQEVTQDFLLARRDLGTLRRIFLLVDARRGASQFDRDIMGWFDDAEIEYSIVLTKSDKVSRPQIVRYANETCMRFHSQCHGSTGYQGPIVHVTSASKNRGINELIASVDAEFTSYFADLGKKAQCNDEE